MSSVVCAFAGPRQAWEDEAAGVRNRVAGARRSAWRGVAMKIAARGQQGLWRHLPLVMGDGGDNAHPYVPSERRRL